jgi:hypothetical protein
MVREQKIRPQAKPELQDALHRIQLREEALDQQLEDSFPASDPPQMTQPHEHVGGPYRSAGETKNKPKRDDKM